MFRSLARWTVVGILAVSPALGAPVVPAKPWLLPPPTPVAAPAPVDPAAVTRWLLQLSHPQAAKRDEAAAALEKFGPGAATVIKVAAAKLELPLEAQRRLDELLPRLEQGSAITATRVNLSLKDCPVRMAVKLLSLQCRYKLELYPAGQPNDERERRLVTVELRDLPFWEALDRLCSAAGLTFHEGWYGSETETLRLEFGESHVGMVCLDGPFRVSIRGFDYSRSLYFNGNPRPQQAAGGTEGPFQPQESLSLQMTISVEPRLPLLSINNQPTLTEAEDENGQSLIPPANAVSRHYYGGGGRSYMQYVHTPLKPSPNGKRIRTLKGAIPITVIAAQKPKLTIDKIMEVKNKTFKDGNTTLVIEEVTKNGQQIAIKLTLTETGANKAANQGAWTNGLQQRLTLLDAKGNKFQSYGGGWSNNGNTVQGTFHFGPPGGLAGVGDAAQLILYEWTTVTHAVPFEFHDLPLP